SKEAFFAPFAKNAPRAAKACGIVLRLLQNNPANMAQEQSCVTEALRFSDWRARPSQSVKSAWLIR
ncbi:MAG: hypothetical protein H7834_01470, partial [Magnetococcus sp. YQC-9]